MQGGDKSRPIIWKEPKVKISQKTPQRVCVNISNGNDGIAKYNLCSRYGHVQQYDDACFKRSRNHSQYSHAMGNVNISCNSGNRSSNSIIPSSDSRRLQDAKKRKRSRTVDDRYNKGVGASLNSNPNSLLSFLSSSNRVQKTSGSRRFNVRFAIPFTAISTLWLSGIFTRDYAAASYSATPLSHPAPMVSIMGTSFSLSKLNPFNPITELFDKASLWVEGLRDRIAEITVDLMAKTYELCATLILKTPLWIFDNEWFENATHQFSIFSLGIVTVLTVLEGVKRMFSGLGRKRKPAMEMKDIMKRWGIVSIALTSIPIIFQKSFQTLNYVSEKVVSMGVTNMESVKAFGVDSYFDLIVLAIFNIVLVGTVIPVLWSNGRRFFDILVLGVISPFALTAWIFDSYRHLFNQWWDNLKQLSLVQVYYALFLLILGWFIFGIPTPDSFTGMVTKLLVVIGGFARMTNPPRIISKHMNLGDGFDEVYRGLGKGKENFKKSARIIKGVAKGPRGVVESVWNVSKRPKVVAPTRMSKFHGK